MIIYCIYVNMDYYNNVIDMSFTYCMFERKRETEMGRKRERDKREIKRQRYRQRESTEKIIRFVQNIFVKKMLIYFIFYTLQIYYNFREREGKRDKKKTFYSGSGNFNFLSPFSSSPLRGICPMLVTHLMFSFVKIIQKRIKNQKVVFCFKPGFYFYVIPAYKS